MTPVEADSEATRRIRHARDTGAAVLDLGDLPLDQLPQDLRGLEVRVLALGKQKPILEGDVVRWQWEDDRPAKPFTDTNALADLPTVTDLNLTKWDRLTDLAGLANLTTLQSLDLSGCEQLATLEPLRPLERLAALFLNWCESLTDLEVLTAFPQLHTLHLSHCDGVANIEVLTHLPRLSRLKLAHCHSIENIDVLARLRSLTSLNLSGWSSFRDVGLLAPLTALTGLVLSGCAALTNLDVVSTLTALSYLTLGGCGNLTTLDGLERLPKLKQLSLDFCRRLADIDALSEATSLVFLNLRGCNYSGPFGPIWQRLTNLEELYLYGSEFGDLPEEVCGDDYDDNAVELVRAYFEDLKADPQADLEEKAFLLGNGYTGKTQLVRKLRADAFEEAWNSTHGVQLHQIRFAVPSVDAPIPVQVWDFGGQDIYHGSHALFLHRHAIYVVLWTPQTEEADYEEHGIPMRNYPLAYWLDYVRSVAGERIAESNEWRVRSPVLIVQSKCDSRGQQAELPNVELGDFDFVEILRHSSKTGRGHENLLERIHEAVEHLHEKRRQPLLGRGRAAVRDWVRQLQQQPEADRPRTLGRDEFCAVCDEVGHVSNPDALLHFLHRRGVVFYKPGLFDDRIIVDQGWALDAIYTLLDRAKTMPALMQHGKFTRRDLEVLLWHERGYGKAEQETFLSMMASCGICFKVRELGDGDWEYLAPELLPEWSTVERELLGWVPDGPAVVSVRIIYSHLHDGILRTFLSRVGFHAGGAAVYWKYGCRFYEEKTRSRVLITSGYDAGWPFGTGSILLRAWGEAPQELLERLLLTHKGIPVGGEPTVEWSSPPKGNGHHPKVAADTPIVVTSAKPDRSDPRTKVYLSYAWGDAESENESARFRERVVEELSEQLRSAGFLVVRDREWLRKGDLVSDFMKEMGRAGSVVCILSAKYLHSDYCMTELNHIYNYSLEDVAEFQRRIVPIVLPDTDIAAPTATADLVAYWEGRADELAAQAASWRLSNNDYALGKRIQGWLLRIPDILDSIRDMIHVRTLDEMRGDDFREVRDLLRGRASAS